MNKSRRILPFFLIIVLIGSLAFLLAKALPHPSQTAQAAVVGLPETSPVGFKRADGPRQFSFPADFGPHLDYQTEWWYYTGNLETASGRHFGFELTFFRRGLLPPAQTVARPSDWATNQVYMAHLTLTDVSASHFYAYQKLERGAAGLAGAQSAPDYQVWLDNWSVAASGKDSYLLAAAQSNIAIDLKLLDIKGPVLEGIAGYSQKGPGVGNASYYFSQPLLEASGTVTIDSQTYAVQGSTWMDHEFSTTALSGNEVGWDWFGLQMGDGSELMLYHLRLQDGSPSPYSSGTFVAKDDKTTYLKLNDFTIQVNSTWKSPTTGAEYPSAWTVSVPSLGLTLQIQPYLPNQELNLAVAYWEGAVKITGERSGQVISGQGYVELTGYAGSLNGQF